MAKPIRRARLHELDGVIDSFLLQAGRGSQFVCSRIGAPGFLQAVIVDRHADHEQIEFGLPDADWSRSRFDAVAVDLEAIGCFCTVEASPSNKVRRFLRARFEGDRSELVTKFVEVLSRAGQTLGFAVDEEYELRVAIQASPEYVRDLAETVERALGPVGRVLGWLLKRSA